MRITKGLIIPRANERWKASSGTIHSLQKYFCLPWGIGLPVVKATDREKLGELITAKMARCLKLVSVRLERQGWCHRAFRVSGKWGWLLGEERLRDQSTRTSGWDTREMAMAFLEVGYPHDDQFIGGLIWTVQPKWEGLFCLELRVIACFWEHTSIFGDIINGKW